MNSPAGPRPLHLVSSTLNSPQSAPITSPKPSSPRPTPDIKRDLKAQRRQSSICYSSGSPDSPLFQLRSSDGTAESRTRSPLSPRINLQRSNSLDRPVRTKTRPESLRGRTQPPGSPARESPMTLTEKYSPLLQFIAQKEQKCLELRSQLARHEEELAALKSKWEKIVSRGIPADVAPGTPNTPGIDLETLRGGVGKLLKGFTAHTQTHVQMPSLSLSSTSRASSEEDPLDEHNIALLPVPLPGQLWKSEEDGASVEIESEKESLGRERSISPSPSQSDVPFVLGSPPVISRTPSTRKASPVAPKPKLPAVHVTPEPSLPSSREKTLRTPSPSRSVQSKNELQTPSSPPFMPPASSIPFQFPIDLVTDFKRDAGKKIGDGLTRTHKRASTLFSDMSSTFLAAIAPLPATSPLKNSPSALSLLDEMDEQEESSVGEVMKPDTMSPTVEAPAPTNGVAKRQKESPTAAVSITPGTESEDEWNW
ncbi:hypothetical protein SISSUDRAFT_1054572 [Sistotremastrum suecicum HHB10207 ss-3]|uniref:Uncharacterized protein n=1 Tax=Sistotremastrum suecicum HHB10207 ss-3 TaxID=1314776 RepID=A0A165YF44_9AGAM|nr:hypothetical protein SISSUDRAFT_1054572 [Sistotremastrum suecicum HHB10207 ss-3]